MGLGHRKRTAKNPRRKKKRQAGTGDITYAQGRGKREPSQYNEDVRGRDQRKPKAKGREA